MDTPSPSERGVDPGGVMAFLDAIEADPRIEPHGLIIHRHGYRGDGAFGQFMVVLPEHDAVVAMFSCVEDMQVVLDPLWQHLLPSFDTPAASPSSVDGIDSSGDRLVISDDDRTIDVPLTATWTVADERTAASATRLADGRVVVDLALLAGPHRLEIELDPVAGTFVARWPLVPLFGAGVDRRLSSMRAPAA